MPHFLDLPQEMKDAIYGAVFEMTAYDYPGTRKAELKVFDEHVMLRRTCAVPPPRWQGARNLMCTCSTVYREVLKFLYPGMEFTIRISGNPKDPQPMRNRLNSEYPLGKTLSCPPLQYIKGVRLLLDAWSDGEMEHLKQRLNTFLAAVHDNPSLNVRYIGFYFDNSARSSAKGSMRSSDEVASMLRHLKGTDEYHQTEVYDPNRTVSAEMMADLLGKINGKDCTHIPPWKG